MSLHVATSAATDITNKWELAQRMAGHTKAPEQALKSVFEGAMQQLEVVANTKFESPMKERVWGAISGQRLKDIRETFMLEFCDQILGGFSEEQAAEMLEEHTRTGAVKDIRYSAQIQTAYALSQSSIIDAVVKKASSMSNGLVPDLVAAVKREGIELRERKRAATTSSSENNVSIFCCRKCNVNNTENISLCNINKRSRNWRFR